MKPLIDADILLYEIGFAGQTTITNVEKIGGVFYKKVKVEPKDWDVVQRMFDDRIKLICDEVEATEPPLLFLTNTEHLTKLTNKKRKFQGENVIEFVPNFREKVAVTKKYKGGRKEEKPYHYKNLTAYIIGKYDYFVAENGLEADDALCIYQGKRKDTIICSRDKDLKQAEGWHFSWECGKQPSFGPINVAGLGWVEKKTNGKIWGVGPKFFYYQLLTGDTVDNIIGVMGRGPKFAYNLLKDAKTERECYELVAEVYVKQFGDEWEERMREMIDLLWIIKTEVDGEPVKWTPPSLM